MELWIAGFFAVGGYYLGKHFPLPNLKSKLSMFFLRATVIFVFLQLGAIFVDYKYYIWGILLGYVWKGFNYGAAFQRKPVEEDPNAPEPLQEARTFPRPPVGAGKKKHKKK